MPTLTTRLSLPTAILVAAGAVAFTPVVAPPPALTAVAPTVAHSVVMPEFQLTASVAEILELPILKQYIKNQITDLAVFGVGWAKAGEGLGKSIRALPEAIVTATKQLLAGDLLGALTTIEKGIVATVTLVGGPLLASRIERNQRTLAVEEAMQAALPAALIGLGTGIFAGFDDVARSVIIAGQNLVDSLLPINIGNVINALVDGVKLIAQGIGEGAGKITDGIVFFQQTIAEALKAQPSGVPGASTALTSASALSVASVPNTADKTVVTLKTATSPVVEDEGGEATETATTGTVATGAVSTPTVSASPTATATPSASATPSVSATPTPKPTEDVTKTGNKFEPGSTVEDNPGSTGTTGSTSTPTTGTPGTTTTTTTTTTDTTTSGGTTTGTDAKADTEKDAGAAAA
jgi:hypothetical protein